MFTPNRHLIVDACCGNKLVRILRKLGYNAQFYREVKPRYHRAKGRSDLSILETCIDNGAVLITRDKRFAESARETYGDVIELHDTRGLISPVEEAYIVLNKLGYPFHHFMLATGIHFGLIWNLETNRASSLNNPTSKSRQHRVMRSDALLQLPIGKHKSIFDPYN